MTLPFFEEMPSIPVRVPKEKAEEKLFHESSVFILLDNLNVVGEKAIAFHSGAGEFFQRKWKEGTQHQRLIGKMFFTSSANYLLRRG